MFARFLTLFLLLCTCRAAFSQPLPDRRPLFGQIVDGAGKPVAGAYISIRRQESDGSFAFWGAAASTDASGSFRFPQAETGSYYLNAELAGFAPIYNLGVQWKNNSSPLKVTFQKLLKLSVELKQADGSPATNLPVWIRLRGDGSAGQVTRRAVSNLSGRVIFEDLQPATYSAFLSSAKGYAVSQQLSLRTDSTVSWQLQSGSELHLAFQEAGTPSKPLGGAVISLVPEDLDAARELMGPAADPNDDFALLSAMGDRQALISRDGDGTVGISHVPPGRYLLRIGGATLNAEPPRPLKISPGVPAETIILGKPKDGASASIILQLTERDGKPALGQFSVRMLPIDSKGALRVADISADGPGGEVPRRALADAGGRVTLYPLALGRYRFFVNHYVPDQISDAAVEASSIDVTVESSGTTASLVLKGGS